MTERLYSGMILAGQYKLTGRLSSGGMGIVCKAQDVELGTPVALKFISSKLAANKLAVERLRREATIGQQLAHPNICRLYGLHSHDDVKFIVMEYVEGKSLNHLLAKRSRNKMTWARLEPIARQIADALDYAHNVVYLDGSGRKVRGVLHRDIKPSNIMITPTGVVKLVDFGIAREMKENITRVTGRQTPGTLLYMPPEQYAGKRITAACDIYAFAATLYECLAGHAPFHRGEIAHQLLNERPKKIPGVPRHVNAALQAGLAKKPGSRPRSAGELFRLMSGKRARRRKLTIAAAAAAAMAALAAAEFGLLGDGSSGPIRRSATALKNWVFAASPKQPRPDRGAASAQHPEASAQTAVAGREEAQEERRAAGEARRLAETAAVEQLAPEVWKAAEENLNKGNEAFRGENFAEAVADYRHAAEAYNTALDQARKMADAARVSAESCRDDVLKVRAEQSAPEMYAGAKKEEAEGRKDFAAGRFAEALAHWRSATDGYRKLRREGEGLANLARGKYELAVEDAGDVIPLLESFGGEAFKRMRDAADRGKAALQPGDSDEDLKAARDHYGEALKLFAEARDAAASKLKQMLAQSQDYCDAEEYVAAMEKIVQILRFRPERGDSLFKDLFEEAGALREAIETKAPYEPARELKTGGQLVLCVACSPDGKKLAAGCFGNVIKVWELPSGRPRKDIAPGHSKDQITCLDFSPDGKRIVSGSWGSTVIISDIDTGESVRLQSSHPHRGRVSSVRFSGCGEYVVSGSHDATAKIWKVGKGAEQVVSTLNADAGQVRCVAVSPCGEADEGPRFVVSGSFDGKIRVWDFENGQCIWSSPQGATPLNAVAFSPDGKLIASGGRDRAVTIWKWNGKAGEEPIQLKGHTGDVESVEFSPDGRRVVSAGADGTIRIWSVAALSPGGRTYQSIQCLQYDEADATEVLSVVFSPDGRFIIAAAGDTVKMWAQEAHASMFLSQQ